MDPAGVVSLEVVAGAARPSIRALPLKVGRAKVTATSRKDPSKAATASIQVVSSLSDAPSLSEDSLLLYVGGESDTLIVTIP